MRARALVVVVTWTGPAGEGAAVEAEFADA
jgi:hypothetical protein